MRSANQRRMLALLASPLFRGVRKYISQQEVSRAVLGEVQFFERPLLNHFLRISLNSLDLSCLNMV